MITFQPAVSYTFETRPSWATGSGRVPARINTNHFLRIAGDLPLDQVTPAVMNKVTQQLLAEGKSPATCNRVIAAVSTLLNHCHMDGLIDTVPRFRKLQESEPRKAWLTKDQVEEVARRSAEGYQDAILVAAYTGMRRGELMDLAVMDIDLEAGLITVGGREGYTTKSKRYRVIPIHDRIRPILERRIEGIDRDVRVFGDEFNGPQLLDHFSRARRKVGLGDEVVFHSLRHSFATWCLASGADVFHVQKLMGHAKIETTLGYTKATAHGLQSTIAAI